MAARSTAYNSENRSPLKHVERRHLFVRECVENDHFVVPFVALQEILLTPQAVFFYAGSDHECARVVIRFLQSSPARG